MTGRSPASGSSRAACAVSPPTPGPTAARWPCSWAWSCSTRWSWSRCPLLLKVIIDDGILKKDTALVVGIAGLAAGLALLDSLLTLAQRWYSARIGEGLIYDLRTQVFRHVQQQPIAFFTRAQTGSLVSRLNSDVIGAQQALTSTLSSVVSNAVTLVLVLITMFLLSWQVTVISLVLVPLFIFPAR